MADAFLSWFDTLDYEPPEGHRKDSKEERLRNNNVKGEYSSRNKKDGGGDGEMKSNKRKVVKDVKLPRVALMSKPKHDENNFENTMKNRFEDSINVEIERKRSELDFWKGNDLRSLFPAIRIVPTLVFDFKRTCIKWACFDDTFVDFGKDTALVNSRLTEIVDSLCHFQGMPIAKIKTDSGEYLPIKTKHAVKDLIISNCKTMESICALSEMENANDAARCIIIKANFPEKLGTVSTENLDKSHRLSKLFELRLGMVDVRVATASEEKSKKISWLESVVGFNYLRKSRVVETLYESTKKNTAIAPNVRWCIGEYCKDPDLPPTTVDCLQQGPRKEVVYRMVLQKRMDVENIKHLAAILPEDLRSRMYETVKVCTLCYDKLWQSENERIAILEEKRARQREEQYAKRCRAIYSKSAEEAAIEARSMAARIQKRQRDFAVHKAIMMQITPEILIDAREQLHPPFDEAADDQLDDFEMDADGTEEDAGEEMPTIPVREPEIIHFDNITTEIFFGDEVAKLALCQDIIQALRTGNHVRLSAPLAQNNNSDEECKLVLRSLYLEFRGMCKDQGFFPEVPIDTVSASMLLETNTLI